MNRPPEVWLRGPIQGVAPLLQPVAHALHQVREDLLPALGKLTPAQLWARPGRSAPIGFHAVHLAGSLSRLFTYARGEPLSDAQKQALLAELKVNDTKPGPGEVVAIVSRSLDSAIAALPGFTADVLLTPREVGRAKLPSTTLGILFQAAEHTARHAGQIQTLLRVLSEAESGSPATRE